MGVWKNEEQARQQIKEMISDYYRQFIEQKAPFSTWGEDSICAQSV